MIGVQMGFFAEEREIAGGVVPTGHPNLAQMGIGALALRLGIRDHHFDAREKLQKIIYMKKQPYLAAFH